MDQDEIQLAREFLKLLEKRKGCPVQLKIETPESIRDHTVQVHSHEFFGSLHSRSLEVKRVEDLNPKYEFDMKILENSYDTLDSLQEHIETCNPLYGREMNNCMIFKGVYSLLHKNVLEGVLTRYELDGFAALPPEHSKTSLIRPLHLNFREKDFEKVHEILHNQGLFDYLHHNIISTFEGIYVSEAGCLKKYTDKKRIADVILEKI